MIRKRLESDWMDERDRESKAVPLPSEYTPCVYLPFLKGTSVDERERMSIYLIEKDKLLNRMNNNL